MFKPIVRIFQNSPEVLKELLPVISNYVSQKRESNADTLTARIYQLIKTMIKEINSAELESSKIWANVKTELNGEDIKAQTIETPDFGPISQKEIIKILKDVFKAKPPKRHGNARSLVFDLKILEKLGQVYDLDINVKVERKERNGTHGTHGTLSGDEVGLDKYNSDTGNEENKEKHTENTGNTLGNSDNSSQIPAFEGEKDPNNEGLNENNTENNSLYPYNVSQVSQASQNSIHRRNPNSDTWECDNCNIRDDIHFMKVHPCEFNKGKI